MGIIVEEVRFDTSEDSELSKKGSTEIQEQELRTLYPLQIQQILVVPSFIQLFHTSTPNIRNKGDIINQSINQQVGARRILT